MEVTTSLIDSNSSQLQFISLDKLISLYDSPPNEELTLDEFELYALDRLQLLRGIENLKTRGFEGNEFNLKLKEMEMKLVPLRTRVPKSNDKITPDQRKDIVSHFILRLAYCRTEELRRWFLTQECHLLKFRLDQLNDQQRFDFLVRNGFSYDEVSQDDKLARKDKLVGLSGVNDANIAVTRIYRVPFQLALGLVSTRQVYIEKGFAYIPVTKLIATVITKFRVNLSKSLSSASIVFDGIVSGDPRIGPLLTNMNKQYIGKDFSKGSHSGTEKLTADQVNLAAEHHMPLCMRNLHMALTREHKLKHWGRLQYGLFLKGAGMELDEALIFWEGQFAKLIQHDQFSKQYAYSFRHMYGKEGARKNYTPYSCLKIIMGTPPEVGSYHGCPFRHLSDNNLVSLLSGLQLNTTDVQEIVKISKSGNYQIACQKHFDITHPGNQQMDLKIDGSVANHPNLWYQASVRYHKLKSGQPLSNSSSTTTTTTTTTANNTTTSLSAADFEEKESGMDIVEG